MHAVSRLTSLQNNALKFSYPTGCIRVTLDVDEHFCTLRFIDAGKGINPDFLRHSIFEAFIQVFEKHPGFEAGVESHRSTEEVFKRVLVLLFYCTLLFLTIS